MESKRSWQFALLQRVVANALVGGLLAALMGALCGLMMSGLIAWLENVSSVARGIPPAPSFAALITASLTAGLAMLVGLLGAIIFAIATARAKPGAWFEPLKSLLARVTLGQFAGTLGFCSLFLAVEAALAALTRQSFVIVASGDFLWLLFGVPALMVCGAIAGALSKRGTQ